MQTQCPRCKAAMTCGVDEKSCWCQTLPSLPVANYTADITCLCNNCLAAALDEGVVMYGIPNCDTIKKARTWLDEQQVPYAFWDYKKHGVPDKLLRNWLAAKGWQTIANTRGPTWRKLDDAVKNSVIDNQTAYAALIANASAIKRPVMMWGKAYGNHMTVGFDALQWSTIVMVG